MLEESLRPITHIRFTHFSILTIKTTKLHAPFPIDCPYHDLTLIGDEMNYLFIFASLVEREQAKLLASINLVHSTILVRFKLWCTLGC